MKTITLNKVELFTRKTFYGSWTRIKCEPQSVEMKSWDDGRPLFELAGIVIESSDSSEIGAQQEITIQAWDLSEIERKGIYSI